MGGGLPSYGSAPAMQGSACSGQNELEEGVLSGGGSEPLQLSLGVLSLELELELGQRTPVQEAAIEQISSRPALSFIYIGMARSKLQKNRLNRNMRSEL